MGPSLWLGAADVPVADIPAALESGRIVVLQDARFEGPSPTLFQSRSDGETKNISFDPGRGALKGQAARPATEDVLRRAMSAYARWAAALVGGVAPAYAGRLEPGRTSYRPRPAEQPLSPRKDDRRLHVDAFPSQPAQGRRILRVFRNVHPGSLARVWQVGEPFVEHAARFLPAARRLRPGEAWLLRAAGLTKARRTAYDQLMLGLHDAAKASADYQRDAARETLVFAPGCTWMLFSDGLPHAALSGRYALEQTFFLPVAAMRDEAASPLRVLEGMAGRRLA
jgi:hypothetical protein